MKFLHRACNNRNKVLVLSTTQKTNISLVLPEGGLPAAPDTLPIVLKTYFPHRPLSSLGSVLSPGRLLKAGHLSLSHMETHSGHWPFRLFFVTSPFQRCHYNLTLLLLLRLPDTRVPERLHKQTRNTGK